MNFSSAFSFGGLIKTILPGFIYFSALVLVIDVSLAGGVFQYVTEKTGQLFLAGGLVLSVMFGLISNTLVFLGLNDWLVRRPHSNDPRNRGLYDAEKAVRTRCAALLCDRVSISGPDCDALCDVSDVEILLQISCDVKNFSSVRDSYWYYLEFQMNSALASVFFSASLSTWLWIKVADHRDGHILSTMIICAATVMFATLMVWSARRNFDRHKRKMLSLCLAGLAHLSTGGNKAASSEAAAGE